MTPAANKPFQNKSTIPSSSLTPTPKLVPPLRQPPPTKPKQKPSPDLRISRGERRAFWSRAALSGGPQWVTLDPVPATASQSEADRWLAARCAAWADAMLQEFLNRWEPAPNAGGIEDREA